MRGAYNDAIGYFTKAISINPQSAPVYLFRGDAYRCKGDLDQAISDYDEAIHLDNRFANAYYNRGIAYFDKGDLDQAISDYDEAIRLDDRFAIAYNNRGNAYSKKGNLDHAISDYDEAIRLDDQLAYAYNGRGSAYYAKRNLDHAISDYGEAIRLVDRSEIAYFNRGNAYSDKGDLDQAISDYDEAIRLDDRFALAYYGRGNAYSNKGDFDQAISDYDEAIRLDDRLALAYNDRGNAYSDKGYLDQAISDYDEAIRLDDRFAIAYINRGAAYYDKGDFDQAISDFDRAIHLNDRFAIAYYNRGKAYYDKGDLDQAISDYDEAIRLDDQYAIAYSNRGSAYSDKGYLDQAISDYDEAIRLDDRDAIAYHGRGNAYCDKEDLDQAISDYDEAIRLDDRFARAYNDRGIAYSYKGDLDQAISDYDEAIRLDDRLAMAYHNRGNAYSYKEDLDRAIRDELTALYLIVTQRNDKLKGKIAYRASSFLSKHALYPRNIVYVFEQIDMEISNYLTFLSDFECVKDGGNLLLYYRFIHSFGNDRERLLNEAILSYYLGGNIETFRIFDEQLDDDSEALSAQALYYYAKAADEISWDADSIWNNCVEQLSDRRDKSDEDYYYLGRLYLLREERSKALDCFTRSLRFPFSALMIKALSEEDIDMNAICELPRRKEIDIERGVEQFNDYFHCRECEEKVSLPGKQVDSFWQVFYLSDKSRADIQKEIVSRESRILLDEATRIFEKSVKPEDARRMAEKLLDEIKHYAAVRDAQSMPTDKDERIKHLRKIIREYKKEALCLPLYAYSMEYISAEDAVKLLVYAWHCEGVEKLNERTRMLIEITGTLTGQALIPWSDNYWIVALFINIVNQLLKKYLGESSPAHILDEDDSYEAFEKNCGDVIGHLFESRMFARFWESMTHRPFE
jgi:tetratricopeptide (TPR) repeat protein